MPTSPLLPCTLENVELHSHRCCSCAHIWHHRCRPGLTEAQLVRAHTCPECAAVGPRPWGIYRGLGSADHLKVIPSMVVVLAEQVDEELASAIEL